MWSRPVSPPFSIGGSSFRQNRTFLSALPLQTQSPRRTLLTGTGLHVVPVSPQRQVRPPQRTRIQTHQGSSGTYEPARRLHWKGGRFPIIMHSPTSALYNLGMFGPVGRMRLCCYNAPRNSDLTPFNTIAKENPSVDLVGFRGKSARQRDAIRLQRKEGSLCETARPLC
jgi:hypothetical protein